MCLICTFTPRTPGPVAITTVSVYDSLFVYTGWMGQCFGSEERQRGRGDEEETRNLMNHEGGYREERINRTPERPVTSAPHSPAGGSTANGYFPPASGRVGDDSPDAPSPTTHYGSVSPPRDRELSDVASGDIGYGSGWAMPAPNKPSSPVRTPKGREVMEELAKGYSWTEQFDQPSKEFLALMDRLYMECQLHLTALSSRGDVESRREADAIVGEMVALRNHWGPQLLPSSTCNAFVRERIPLTLGVEQRQFRIDCAQFFEPVPFYGSQQSSCAGELMKLHRFSVYNMVKNDVVLRYYLERSNVTQFYHVLCFMDNNCHGQVKPYGSEVPSYWEVRQNMLDDLRLRLLNSVSPGSHPMPKPLALTVFPPDRVGNNLPAVQVPQSST